MTGCRRQSAAADGQDADRSVSDKEEDIAASVREKGKETGRWKGIRIAKGTV